MALMTTFLVDDTFPLERVNLDDRRFMSRTDREAWEEQVESLMVQIAQQGLLSPVGVARLSGESRYIVIYGFTRSAAVYRLGWPSIRANVYDDLNEPDARMLNAVDNAAHKQLTDWERALQMQKLRAIGIPVESSNGGPSLTSIFGMSKRTIFNWLGIVSYDLPALHQAIAEKKLGLQHALVFRDYPLSVSEQWIERCIQGEWSSGQLKVRLSTASDAHQTETAPLPDGPGDRATLHGISSQTMPMSATLHGADEAVHPQLIKASRWILQSGRQFDAWAPDEQQEFKELLRPLLKFIASHPTE
jgi:ParB-like nuclease domain